MLFPNIVRAHNQAFCGALGIFENVQKRCALVHITTK